MKLKFSKNTSNRTISRLTKKIRIRKTVKGTLARPRLCVFRSSKHIYAQVIDDVTGQTLISFSSLELDKATSGKDQAEMVGQSVAKEALSKGLGNVVFDRNGYIYHGRVKALADGARKAGLNF
jgi:large subunit ribosomal protein L18